MEASSRPTRPKQITPKEFKKEFGIGGNLEVTPTDGGTEAHADDHAEAHEQERSDEGADTAEIVDPLTDAQANNVENHQ